MVSFREFAFWTGFALKKGAGPGRRVLSINPAPTICHTAHPAVCDQQLWVDKSMSCPLQPSAVLTLG